MRTFIKIAVICIALLFFAQILQASSAVATSQDDSPNRQSESTRNAARARSVFGERCARCHGSDGRGRTTLGDLLGTPDFTNQEWWGEEKSKQRLVHSITEGKDEMPAFRKKLSKRDISSLADYVRAFRKPDS